LDSLVPTLVESLIALMKVVEQEDSAEQSWRKKMKANPGLKAR
jgi:hypothetical protein